MCRVIWSNYGIQHHESCIRPSVNAYSSIQGRTSACIYEEAAPLSYGLPGKERLNVNTHRQLSVLLSLGTGYIFV